MIVPLVDWTYVGGDVSWCNCIDVDSLGCPSVRERFDLLISSRSHRSSAKRKVRTYDTLYTMFSSSVRNNIQSTLESASSQNIQKLDIGHTLISDQTGDIDNLSISPWVSSSSSFWDCLACDTTSGTQHVFTYSSDPFSTLGRGGHTGITCDLEYGIQVDL
jgi:hypothetical protein